MTALQTFKTNFIQLGCHNSANYSQNEQLGAAFVYFKR